jgi:toxin secretion/phage lysis holin
MDYLTGLLVGATGKSKKTEKGGISSYVGFLGIVKKAIIFVVIAVVHGCETFLPGETIIVTQSVTIAFACNEAVSILENVGLLGIDLGPVKQLLEVLKKKSGDEDD